MKETWTEHHTVFALNYVLLTLLCYCGDAISSQVGV